MAIRPKSSLVPGRMAPERVTVECYAGHAYPTEPRAFTFGGERHVVQRIVRRWRTPSAFVFQVLTQEEELFTLAYFEDKYAWVMLDSE